MSRFKLRNQYRRSCRIYIYGDPVHGPSSVPGRKTKTDIRGRMVCAIVKEKAV